MSQFASLPPAERFAQILNDLFRAISRRGSPGYRFVPIAAPLLALIWTRLTCLRNRLLRALATPYAPRRRGSVIARSAAPKQSRRPPQPPPPYTVPRHKGWLLFLIQETGGAGSQLAHCLNQPDAQALIAADPRLGRILRSLCHALFIRPSQIPCLYPKPAPAPAPATIAASPSDCIAPPQPLPPPLAASPPSAKPPARRPPARRTPRWPRAAPAGAEPFIPA